VYALALKPDYQSTATKNTWIGLSAVVFKVMTKRDIELMEADLYRRDKGNCGWRAASFWVSAGLLAGLISCSPAEAPIAEAPTADTPAVEDRSPAIRFPSIRLSGWSVVPIASLMADSADSTVAVSGTVVEKVPVLESWLYQVQDDSGSVWVQSKGSDPVVGDAVTVEGVVRYEAIVVDGIDAGEVYLEERAYQSGAR